MVATLACESFVLDPRPRYPLLIPVKRYWSPEHYSTGRDALTFVCAHGASFSKEHWAPTIKHLYDHASSQCTPSVKIREFWAVDAPRHGESSALNDGVDHWEGGKICPWENYARSIHAVLSGMAKGLNVKFHNRRLVGLGHSLGANALLLTNGFIPDYTFSSLILVEPVLLPRPHPAQRGNDFGLFVESSLNKFALRRRDTWRSREEALESCRKAFRRWHPGIVEIFIRHNLRELPTPKYPQSQGVTLSCTREDEAACSYDPVERTRCYKYFGIQCKKQPVHLVFGASSEIAPDYIINDIVTVGSGGKHASLAKVAGAGHLVPQMQPRRLSDAIWVALLQDATGGEEVFRSRL